MRRKKCENTGAKMIQDFKVTYQKLPSPLNHMRSVVLPENSIKLKAVILISVIEFI